MDIEINYVPREWAMPFHTGVWTHACNLGGLGGGKSTASLQELVACAMENPGFTYVIARKTLPSLRLTTLKTFLNIVPPKLIAKKHETQLTWTLVNGSEFVFLSLDDPEKLKSMEIAGFFINEANEIDKVTYDTLKSRVRQKVNGKPPTRYRTIIDLNPVDESHWIPQLFMHNCPPGHAFFHSTTFDNLENLPEGYLEMLQTTYTPEEQKRLIYGLCSKVHLGNPVYPEFRTGNYITSIDVDPNLPLVRGWDFGFQHPACIWLQMRGEQIRVLGEKLGEKLYLDDFVENHCIPFENNVLLAGVKGGVNIKRTDFCDPRGADKSDKGRTSIEVLNGLGIYPAYRRTWIDEGIKAVRSRLVTMNAQTKEPNFLIHPRCTILAEAMRGGYKRLDGEETPHKDGYYDNIADAARYPILHCVHRAKITHLSKGHDDSNTYVNKHTGRRVER